MPLIVSEWSLVFKHIYATVKVIASFRGKGRKERLYFGFLVVNLDFKMKVTPLLKPIFSLQKPNGFQSERLTVIRSADKERGGKKKPFSKKKIPNKKICIKNSVGHGVSYEKQFRARSA